MSEFIQLFGTPLVVVFCFGLTIWLIKSDLACIRKRMDCFEASQHACQLANAKDYATWDAVNKLDDKVGDLGGRVSKLEVRKQ